MVIWATVALALRTLRGNLFRTILTMLSVTIGAFSIVAMLSLAESGQATLSAAVEQIGGMRMVLWIPSEGREATARERAVYDRGFTDQDLLVLRRVPYLAQVAIMSGYGTEAVWARSDERENVDIVGVREGLLEEILDWSPESGRLITEEDNTHQSRVAVLTAPLAEKLFAGRTAVGQTVFVGRKPYVVIGVLETRELMGISFGFSWENSVFVPLLTAEKREGRTELARFVVGLTADPRRNDSVVAMANAALLSNHRQVHDFQSIDFSSFLEQFYSFFLVLDLIVAAIAGVSLFAGGIGVMNIMLVSVTERVREIGVRRALGASRPTILVQFLVEASTLSLIGGLLGVGVALLVVTLVNLGLEQAMDNWVGRYSVLGISLSLGTTAGIGVLFGAVPAWRAARLDIVDCLRR